MILRQAQDHSERSRTMNTKSIRFKLTLIYSSVIIFSIAILFAAFYWVTIKEFYDHTDIILRLHAEQLKNLVIGSGLQSPNINTVPLSEQSQEAPGMLAFVTDETGKAIFSSQQIDEPILTEIFQEYVRTRKETLLNQRVGSQIFRFILLPVNTGNTSQAVIMGHPIDVIQQSLNSLYINLFLIFLSLIIPTILGGYFLAGSALRPIGEIADEMEKLSAENLKKKIRNPGTRDEVDTLATAFNRLIDRLDNALNRERQFIGDVAHEMKTPLATVRGAIDVSLSKPRTIEEYKSVLKSLRIDTDRLSQTLTNILDLAWSQTDASQSLLEPVSLTDIGRELLEIGQKLAYEKQIIIHSHIEENVIVQGKKDKLFRSLLNFVDNAIKYTGKKGKITINIKKNADMAVVTIKDAGVGIHPEDLPHIFDRFYRGKKSDKTLGSGLGLSIAHGIISSLGGRIEVSSNVGKGTTFRISLPLLS